MKWVVDAMLQQGLVVTSIYMIGQSIRCQCITDGLIMRVIPFISFCVTLRLEIATIIRGMMCHTEPFLIWYA